jgi:hypothetical protein
VPGPQPKPPGQKRRRNIESTARTLVAVPITALVTPKLPELEGMEWHPATVAFWDDLWSSPMAPEYDSSDLHGLFMLADLVNAYWQTPSRQAITRSKIAAEIRLQRQCFGLTPIDRRRLQWTIERVDESVDAGNRRRAGQSARSGGRDDPRLRNELDESVDTEV